MILLEGEDNKELAVIHDPDSRHYNLKKTFILIRSINLYPYFCEMQTEWFTSWFDTPYYHELYQNRDEKDAENFIKSLIGFLQPRPMSKMLDLACGKGRHAKYLYTMGYDVTGIDISPSSIVEANIMENEYLHFFQHDMRKQFWTNYFDYVFNFFTSFGYFNSERENDKTLQSISQSLKKGGILVIDYLNVIYAEKHLVPKETKVINNNKYEISRFVNDFFICKKIIVEDRLLEKKLPFEEKVAKYTLDHFKAFFQKNNLSLQSTFGDYQLNPFHEDESPRLILVAEKL
jgi:SAM-dependent methyltransferase